MVRRKILPLGTSRAVIIRLHSSLNPFSRTALIKSTSPLSFVPWQSSCSPAQVPEPMSDIQRMGSTDDAVVKYWVTCQMSSAMLLLQMEQKSHMCPTELSGIVDIWLSIGWEVGGERGRRVLTKFLDVEKPLDSRALGEEEKYPGNTSFKVDGKAARILQKRKKGKKVLSRVTKIW